MTETTKGKIKKYAEEVCCLLSMEIGTSVNPDYYDTLLKKYDRLFMERMGIENDFCIYHVLHWILMESGMESEFYVELDKKRDRSRIYGDKISQRKIKDNLQKYEDVICEKVLSALCPVDYL